jgi:hypothetical protein
VRQSDLAKARINRGTCPDMCPEKERYHREFQRQVAAYEVGGAPGKMDHRAAVKQYSRSSADQVGVSLCSNREVSSIFFFLDS